MEQVVPPRPPCLDASLITTSFCSRISYLVFIILVKTTFSSPPRSTRKNDAWTSSFLSPVRISKIVLFSPERSQHLFSNLEAGPLCPFLRRGGRRRKNLLLSAKLKITFLTSSSLGGKRKTSPERWSYLPRSRRLFSLIYSIYCRYIVFPWQFLQSRHNCEVSQVAAKIELSSPHFFAIFSSLPLPSIPSLQVSFPQVELEWQEAKATKDSFWGWSGRRGEKSFDTFFEEKGKKSGRVRTYSTSTKIKL